MSILLILLLISLIIICCVVIWRASDGFEVASSYLGRNLRDGVRGSTINAIGSSMPELFTTFWFLFVFADKDGFAGGIATTAGSAIFNGMIIPAVVILAVLSSGIIKSITVSRKVLLRDGISLIIAELILIAIISGAELHWYHGLALILIYGIYLYMTFNTMGARSKTVVEEEEEIEPHELENWVKSLFTLDFAPLFLHKKQNNTQMWGLLITSMIVIGAACLLLVFLCEEVGIALGIHYYFVAVIIASAATSVPDTIISYRDAMKGQYDDAIANALGSNIFDICFALGLPLLVYTVLNGAIIMDGETVNNISEMRFLLVLLTIVAFFTYIIGKKMDRIKAVILIFIYLVFTAYILGRAYDVAFVNQIGEHLRSILDF